MAFTGAPDYQSQQSQTVTAFPLLTVNANPSQTSDITDNFQPMHQTLLVYWIASAGSVGQGCNVRFDCPLSGVTLQFETSVADGGYSVVRVPGQMVIGPPGGGCDVTVSVIPGDPAPLTGNLQIIALTETLDIHEDMHRLSIGTTQGSIQSTIAGGTNTLLGAPPLGQRNRILGMTLRAPGGPAATQFVDFFFGTSLLVCWRQQVLAGVADSWIFPCDFYTTESIRITNNLSVVVGTQLIFARYPA